VKGLALPASSHSEEVELLRLIELNQRSWHWAHTKEASNKETAPEPLLLKGEKEAIEQADRQAEQQAEDVAKQFGLAM
jgi:hypothetical protein